MRRVRSVAAVAVVTAVVTALVVVSTVGSLGSVIAFAGGGLVVLGVGGALCVALGALIRRLGRPIPTGERSD